MTASYSGVGVCCRSRPWRASFPNNAPSCSTSTGEGDRVFELHEQWIAETHARDGDKALLSYNIAKGPEASNPLDPSSEPTGNTCYALNEVYESQAGVDDHWQQAQNWEHFGDLFAWASKCKVATLHGSPVVRSHW